MLSLAPGNHNSIYIIPLVKSINVATLQQHVMRNFREKIGVCECVEEIESITNQKKESA